MIGRVSYARPASGSMLSFRLEKCREKTTNAREAYKEQMRAMMPLCHRKTRAVKKPKELEGNFGFPRLYGMTWFNSAPDVPLPPTNTEDCIHRRLLPAMSRPDQTLRFPRRGEPYHGIYCTSPSALAVPAV